MPRNAPSDPYLLPHLEGCARCHGDGHDGLTFQPLTHPVEYEDENVRTNDRRDALVDLPDDRGADPASDGGDCGGVFGVKLVRQRTPALGRFVMLRPDGSDRQVWADTFTGLYHLPPPEMPVPSTVLDLGANIGLTAAHYQKLWPEATIMAVEMDADCCELIRMNAPGVGLGQYAVSAEGGIGHFDPTVRAEAQAFSTTDPGVGVRRPVMSHTLRQIILRAFGDDGVDFVKMDVEGSEWGIFEYGDWAPLVRHLVVELHDGLDREALISRAIGQLTRLGFEVRLHPPHPQAVYAWMPGVAR